MGVGLWRLNHTCGGGLTLVPPRDETAIVCKKPCDGAGNVVRRSVSLEHIMHRRCSSCRGTPAEFGAPAIFEPSGRLSGYRIRPSDFVI